MSDRHVVQQLVRVSAFHQLRYLNGVAIAGVGHAELPDDRHIWKSKQVSLFRSRHPCRHGIHEVTWGITALLKYTGRATTNPMRLRQVRAIHELQRVIRPRNLYGTATMPQQASAKKHAGTVRLDPERLGHLGRGQNLADL
ncbi:hypothetical protein SAMN05421505_10620 [Sinosporangium album]|uniref:Uncharacterized protein n=1 Tax=Sinosporangium album TaxID=504805 RepID=A0A1G7VUS8_9ACTN|nr:hypothetical protein SAMN05421505_10620 [Sinosporangium album]